jgi:ubiquinone/menaquinone biosynthesis C-methylase UbiE
MTNAPSKQHWDNVYSTKAADAVSWHQIRADRSLQLIETSGVAKSASIIDVGGGASTLPGDLLAAGYSHLTVLDWSSVALAAAREKLGAQASAVQWLEADITKASLPAAVYDIWHDRAVFHFLTSAEDRSAYVRTVLHALKPGGHLIIATFASDGPTRCSGLPVVRYDASELHAEFGAPFTLERHEREAHHTPWGAVQQFVYCHCRRRAA